MRPPAISIERCLSQAKEAREAAMLPSNVWRRGELLHMADAYDSLARKAR